jgi:hypothetical protein
LNVKKGDRTGKTVEGIKENPRVLEDIEDLQRRASKAEMTAAARNPELPYDIPTIRKTRDTIMAHTSELASIAKRSEFLFEKQAKKTITPEELNEMQELAYAWTYAKSDAGRSMNMFKIENPALFDKIMASLPPARVKFILDMERKGLNWKAIEDEIDKVDWKNQEEATTFYRKFMKPGFEDIWKTTIYANMLSSIKTQLVNTIGGWYISGVDYPIRLGARGGLDWMRSVADGIKRKATGTGDAYQRRHFAGEASEYLKKFYTEKGGLGAAWNNALDVFKGKWVEDAGQSIDQGLSFKLSTKEQKVARAVEDFYTMFSSSTKAQDAFMKTLSAFASKGAVEYAEKKGAKRSVDAIEEMIREATYSSRPGADEGIVNKGMDFLGQLATKMANINPRDIENLVGKGNAGESLIPYKSIATGIRVATGTIIPFIRWVQQAAKQGISRTPFGLLNLIGNNQQKTRVLADAAIGLPIIATATMLGFSDRLTGPPPRNREERELDRASGIQPYSITIPGKDGKDYNIGMTALPPILSFPMIFTSTIQQAIKDRKLKSSDMAAFYNSFPAAYDMLMEMSTAKGLQNFSSALSGDVKALNVLNNATKQLLPWSSFFSYTERLLDEYERSPDKREDLGKQWMDNALKQYPGLANKVQPTRTKMGDTITQTFSTRLLSSVLPFNVKEVKPELKAKTEKMRELRKVTHINNELKDGILVAKDMPT